MSRITKEEILNQLEYKEETGEFFWRDFRKRKGKNGLAGSIGKDGYVRICINYRMYLAHRLAWFIKFDEWPHMLDHIDRNPTNNRLNNLRKSNYSDNMMNSWTRIDNSTGARGVQQEPRTGKWYARKRKKYLGTFNTFEEAVEAYNVEL